METEMKLYPRKCDCCNKGMDEGFYDAGNYWCSEECLLKGNYPYTMKDWERDCEENEEECYWTEWEELDEYENYTAEGELYYTCQSCGQDTHESEVHEESFCPYCLQEIC